jgi:cation diffusion facilitator CzcD-associated flavoprotein CzcO
LRAKLTPDYTLGCKRILMANDYYPALQRDNVQVISDGIERITERGIVTKDGQLHELDLLILGTGFKTLEKGNAPSFEVYGIDGVELGEHWDQNRYQAFNGTSVPDFPNYFMTSSPYSGGFNWFTMLDAHLKYMMRCMKKARRSGSTWIEAEQDAHDQYFRFMLERAEGTVFKDPACLAANSYYIDRHGDASLALPQTPWWRLLRLRFSSLSVFRFQ